MISVGSSDARKGLGLGFGVGVREMDETELEEGEAFSYNNKDDFDASIDPDIALSYIDEKLQDVLGHFQKDFEGGVTAENLGAKFGGYGSFLPSYQRSPGRSHPKASPEVQNSTTRSPTILQLEGGRRSCTASSAAPQKMRLGSASSGVTCLPGSKAPSLSDSANQETRRKSSHAESHEAEAPKTKPSCFPDQKTLKVRIKVGSDNLAAQKNAAIYSGLGLNISPSSSMENSPSESEGIYHESLDAPFESPNSIVMVMTSFPLPGDLMLSPLCNDLMNLSEKGKQLSDSGCIPDAKLLSGSSKALANGYGSGRVVQKLHGEKKLNLMERTKFSVEPKSSNKRDFCDNNVDAPNQAGESDTFSYERLLSKTLKLPILSTSYSTVTDSAKGMTKASDSSTETSKGSMRNKMFNGVVMEEPAEPVFKQEPHWDENLRPTLAEREWEGRKVSYLEDSSAYGRKDGHFQGDKPSDLLKIESKSPKRNKAAKIELIDSPMKKVTQRDAWHGQECMKLPTKKENVSSGGKRKSKGSKSHSILGAEVTKGTLRVSSSGVPKSNLSTHLESNATKRESQKLKSRKDAERVDNWYTDFFGEMAESEEENRASSLQMKDSEKVVKSSHPSNNALKEKLSGKKPDKLSKTEAYPKPVPNSAPRNANGPIPDAAALGTTFIENWVCCDKCQTWRLLPLGLSTDNLPEKWLCSMLTWLPGMNRCSFSEEETSKAVMAMYQVPQTESQYNLHGNLGGTIPQDTLGDVKRPDQDLLLGAGKSKQGFKEVSQKEGPTGLLNSVKKSMQTSIRRGSLHGLELSPEVNEPDIQNANTLSDLRVETHKHKKELHRKAKDPNNGGDTKSSKMKSKRNADQDCFGVSKKSKNLSVHCTSEDNASDHGGTLRKGVSSCNDLAVTSAWEDVPTYNAHPKNSESDKKEKIQVSSKKPRDSNQVTLDDGSLDLGNLDNKDGYRKRKGKESMETQDYMGPHPSTGYLLQDGGLSIKEFSANDHRKEKKARVSKSGGNEFSASNGRCNSDKRGSQKTSQQIQQDIGTASSQRRLDGVDSLKKNFGPAQLFVTATSSSSQVSGSHKTRGSYLEVKGSPVESVSSSPMRMSKTDKLMFTRRTLDGKDKSQDNGFFITGSPRRPLDGEDGGSDRSGIRKKEKPSRGHHDSLGMLPSHDVTDNHPANGSVNGLDQDTLYPGKPQTLDLSYDEEKYNDKHYPGKGSRPRKSGKGSSSRSKDRNRSSRSGSINGVQDHAPSYDVKPTDSKTKFQETFGVKSKENKTRYVDKEESTGKLSSESSKRESDSNLEKNNHLNAKIDACSQDGILHQKHNLPQDYDGEAPSKRCLHDKTDQERGNLLSLPPSGIGHPKLVSGPRKVNGANIPAGDTSQGDDAPRLSKQARRNDHQTGTQPINSRHLTPDGGIRDFDAPSPLRKEPSTQAATNALKEAKDLKHLADRLKNSGSNHESTGLYFQAALKFLHGASLLESCSIERSKHGEMIQSIQIYSSTAKLCEFCAHEYEKFKDMAAAALAYKCMEVAFMRVVYSSHSSANRDRHELQTALQMVPPGESPSSSASDVDNLNHPQTADKVASSKGISSPQVAGNHIISARNRPNFVRLLKFTQDVNLAMEASRKSQIAFAAANIISGEPQHMEAISSIKRAIDFNFQDVEGLLRGVRLAMEAISR